MTMRREPAAASDPSAEAPKLSFEAARAKVAHREELDAWQTEQAAIPTYYEQVPPSDLLDMFERGRNERGAPLTNFEWEALACQLYERFGAMPEPPVKSDAIPKQAEHADDTMLDIKEVARMVGLSPRTVDRKTHSDGLYHDPAFPKPVRISERRIRWHASEMKAFVASREVTRRALRR